MEVVVAKKKVDPFSKIKKLTKESVDIVRDGLVENPFAAFEDKADVLVPTATLGIYQFVRDYLDREKSSDVNRASAANGCYKKRWFKARGYAEKEMAPRAIVNFMLGDLTERVVLYFIEQALVGPGKLYSEIDLGEVTGSIHFQGKELKIYRQQDLVAQVGKIPVTAHADGWGKRNADGKWELIEIKSSANYGFDDFKKIGPKEYLKQSHVLMQTGKAIALGVHDVRFFYLRKETGHLWDRKFSFDPFLWDEVVSDYDTAQNCVEPPVTPFPLTTDKKGRLVAKNFPCGYCPYLEACHGPHQVLWETGAFGVQKPIYVFEKGEL